MGRPLAWGSETTGASSHSSFWSMPSSVRWFLLREAILLGVGTGHGLSHSLAAISDVAHASWRASAVGVYRLWRDLGYAAGALVAGVTADLLGVGFATCAVAGLTFVSGLVVATRMRETRPRAVSR